MSRNVLLPGPTAQSSGWSSFKQLPAIGRRQVAAGRTAVPSDRGNRWRFGLVFLFALVSAPRARAQQPDFQATDSLIHALAQQYRWAELDSVGRAQLRGGTDYPALRRRLGQAALALDRPALAIRHYGRALRENPLDTTARYGLTLAYLELNQPGPAALLARGLPDSLRRPLHLMGFRPVTRIELEATAQQTRNVHRGGAGFGRLGLSSRLGPRLTLTQSVSRFGQEIELPDPYHRRFGERYDVRQKQYHALLGGQLAPRWRALLAYHFLDSDFGRARARPDHLGYAALAYARPYWTAQAGLYFGTLTDTARQQADLRLTVYPLGNLRLYGFGRASVVRSGGRNYPNGVLGVGGRLHRRLWAEAYGGLGQVPVLAELDGTYVYNLFDAVRQRGSASLLILLARPLLLRLSFGTEQRRDAISGGPYTLNSLSTALAWTW